MYLNADGGKVLVLKTTEAAICLGIWQSKSELVSWR